MPLLQSRLSQSHGARSKGDYMPLLQKRLSQDAGSYGNYMTSLQSKLSHEVIKRVIIFLHSNISCPMVLVQRVPPLQKCYIQKPLVERTQKRCGGTQTKDTSESDHVTDTKDVHHGNMI
jgi:hypothetical protein